MQKHPIYIDEGFIDSNCFFEELVSVLQVAFSSNKTIVPQRHHHNFSNSEVESETTMLLMPAFNPKVDSGVKVVTINPNNSKYKLPSIQGSYLYMDATTGQLKAILEAKSLTAKRTAATSALASKYLSKSESDSLLMIGTGALSPNLIKAHTSVRPIKKVYVWGRELSKARKVVDQFKAESFEIKAVSDIDEVISEVSIVSCATLSETPLVLGANLTEGQHIDLVGSYKPNMREADDNTIKKATVFLDSYEGGLKESGDIAIPLQSGVLKEESIGADLFELCSGKKKGRTNSKQITLFKSVGHALEDLAGAAHFYEKFIHANNLR
ncbi:ornithine cyclodeaminase family protein [Croceivirga thetidis]|uniref:Ornithine cyclodeaminase family protein n=1 Tax=Croceivirga thetidis TaxID=2721623 RepID=A0ABX1GNJ3_9FLAO|nr:ornithine cyclodeaminase family protein [Croceivirga thetidis]NKI30357.1 ornithine cyclodeaminase family protein [Croceivirga thetidis]